MNLVSKIGKKYTIYIPKEIVKKLNLKEGEKIIIKAENGKIIIKRVDEFFKKRKIWSEISFEELEKESEELIK
ncbi:MAG: AbrB/MazE/SpoVT family DNA-binding domain-containing protein [Candidatus Asgardarchaeia archaeon]